MCSVLFLPVYSLFSCFRSSHAYHMCLVCSYLCTVCSNVSEALMLPYVFGSVLTCVQSVQMFQKLSCLPYVFGSVLACVQSAHMFQKLSYSLCRPCLCNNFSSDSNAFHCVLRLPKWQYTMLSFSLMRRHDHSHKLTSSCALRYYTVGIPFSDAYTYWTPLHALWYYTVGIPFWTSHKRQSLFFGHNHLSSTDEKSQYHVLQVMWSHIIITYMLRRGIWKYCTWRKWLGKFIMLLTFELSSSEKMALLHFPHCSRCNTCITREYKAGKGVPRYSRLMKWCLAPPLRIKLFLLTNIVPTYSTEL